MERLRARGPAPARSGCAGMATALEDLALDGTAGPLRSRAEDLLRGLARDASTGLPGECGLTEASYLLAALGLLGQGADPADQPDK